MPKEKPKIVIAHVPVLHRGYMQFFDAYKSAEALYIIGEEFIQAEDYLRKDVRALQPDEASRIISAAGYFQIVKKLKTESVGELDKPGSHIVLPDEDISRRVAKLFKKAEVTLYPVFLRWDRRSVEDVDQTDPDEELSEGKFEQSVMKHALDIAGQSSDIWRRVGAVLMSADNKTTEASNQGEPHAHSPWMEGDPRNIFSRGVGIEMSVFSHAEATLIAEAARRGTALEGATIFVSTFPCPACAKLIAHSGIKTCYYKDGYAVLDGKRVLEDYGVRLVRVRLDDDAESSRGSEWVPYEKPAS